MSVAHNLDARPEALDALRALLDSSSRATRTAAAHAWGRLTALRDYSVKELREFKTDYDRVYAVKKLVSPGTWIMLLFSVETQSQSVRLKLLNAVEVIGQTQCAAAAKDTQRYL
jgi:hypothetical protein